MRTTLLLTAAVGLVASATSFAQVYSVNAVGYVNATMKAGSQMIANPLDAGAGNNTVSKLLPATLPEGTTVYIYSGGGFVASAFEFGAWSNPDLALPPGVGAFVIIPAGSPDTKVTFIGEVPLGTASNMQLVNGIQLIGSKVPQAGKLSTDLKFPAADGDTVYQWAGTAYSGRAYDFGAWSEEPVIAVGEGFWVVKAGAAAWDRNFSIAQ